MYLWNIDELKKTLSKEGLSEQSCFYYLLLWIVLSVLAVELAIHDSNESLNIWDTIYSYGSAIVSIVGVYLFYKANGGETGKHILERYFSIGIVVPIRLIPALVIIMIPLGLFIDSSHTTPVETAFLLSWIGFVYHRMIKHVREVALIVSDT